MVKGASGNLQKEKIINKRKHAGRRPIGIKYFEARMVYRLHQCFRHLLYNYVKNNDFLWRMAPIYWELEWHIISLLRIKYYSKIKVEKE